MIHEIGDNHIAAAVLERVANLVRALLGIAPCLGRIPPEALELLPEPVIVVPPVPPSLLNALTLFVEAPGGCVLRGLGSGMNTCPVAE